jgi:UDP-N-acetylmuramoyl-tripeptide--D-alanyl-D-alanine ligase
MQLSEIEEALNVKALSTVEASFHGVGTDTRKSLKQQIFFALRGDNFDAHDFLADAIAQNAGVLIIDKPVDELDTLKSQVTIIQVADTLKALQDLAKYWRRKINPKVVGISGSAGKTTTKEFCYQILKNHFNTHYSPGSFNNHWGVPISLLQLTPDHEVMILEMGMSSDGELTELCKIAEPDVVLVTNVGSAHIGELGSLKAVAAAKEELYHCSPKATSIFNISNEWTMEMFERAKESGQNYFTFSSFSSGANIQMRVEKTGFNFILVSGQIGAVEGRCEVPVFGRHNVQNIMGASAIAMALGMSAKSIWDEIPHCKGVWGRNELYKHASGAHIIFDAYNANPESMTALVKNVYEMDVVGEKRVLFGEMLELGELTEAKHEELGKLVCSCGFQWASFMGESFRAFKKGVESCGFYKGPAEFYPEYNAKTLEALDQELKPGDVVVIKGSRGMKLERVLKHWEAQGALSKI